MTVYDFLESLGGRAQVARTLGVPYMTVVSWCNRGSIPAWRMPKLAELAVAQGVAVPASFEMNAA